MSREKILRKKLLEEPDEFHTLSQRAWLWVHANRDRTALAAGGVLAVVLIGIGAKAWVERSNEQRSTAVSSAITRYAKAQGAAIPADLRHELAGLAERYAGSPEGAVARYFQAGALAASGEIDQARQLYGGLAKEDRKAGDLATFSRVALAYLDLARGARDTALTAFQELIATRDAAVPRAQIMMEIAAIHEKQGRAAEARKVYQELLAEHPDGPWATDAKEQLRQLPDGKPVS